MKKYGRATILEDPYLTPYLPHLRRRHEKAMLTERRLTGGKMTLADFASGHEYFGLHRSPGGWIFREWAPHASAIFLIGEFSGWEESDEYSLNRISDSGVWEGVFPSDLFKHGDLYKLKVHWPGGSGERLPSYVRRVVQDENTKIFSAQVWDPPVPYRWKCRIPPPRLEAPLIYEAHVGMAQEKEGVGTYDEFRLAILPRILIAGYNTIQLMAIMEHPYYGSFGYHVSNFFAASSRFGTPEDLKRLIDEAHMMGLRVIMDLVHSHAANNEAEGISRFDGTLYQYFHAGERGRHVAWDSRCFDYGKTEVLHFLLSNCRFWLDEYGMDGFRFDGVTSMIYMDHGLGQPFTSYERYFDGNVDEDAIVYLTLANKVVHSVRRGAITIAEDVSGMPGLAAPSEDGGCGFDYRLAMGVPDCWEKLVTEVPDDDWNMGYIWFELTNRRRDERTIGYTESHDQAIVGGKTIIFHLADKEMYTHMRVSDNSLIIDRAMALHKMARLATIATAGDGYLNFMGNEFGHPEWVDFPREGNNWSYRYARRQWHLRDDPLLRYRFLADFDRAMVRFVRKAGFLGSTQPRPLVVDEVNKILAFERGGYCFLFNFHPARPAVDYFVEIPCASCRLLMDTDEPRFGGHGRLKPDQTYYASPHNKSNALIWGIKVYLPPRTALVAVLQQDFSSTTRGRIRNTTKNRQR